MEAGQNSDSFLLASLAEHFPKLTSFPHTGAVLLEPYILPQRLKRYQSLQALNDRVSEILYLDAEHLRWVIKAFPGLQQPSCPRSSQHCIPWFLGRNLLCRGFI